ncbi:unnamed protein product [Adineta steineri]|uniref:Methyltransferase domain-containing protein n=1 Tax=Adineta steineri TaxID=433720 RepID=A0A819AF08_9BILA|nr:unnamed protein product [Adineta steineri]CAF3781071.1 unnamed protein product [Adineta steineri]
MSYAYDVDEFSRYYDTFVANHVTQDAYWVDTVCEIYAEIIQRTFIDNQQTIIIDLGCGTGKDLIYFENYFKDKNIKLIGIDHSQAMLERAKDKLNNQSTNNQIELLHGDLTNFANCLETKIIDCILLPAGTFHHLITDDERHKFINNIQQTLRPQTGLFAIYLMPDCYIYIAEPPIDNSNNQDKLQLISVENTQQNNNNNDEWICKQTFEFDIPPEIELSWQLRTCNISKFIQLFLQNNFEPVFCCLNGKELLSYDENISSLLNNNNSTPVILVFRSIKNTN